jgi:hypothetical protein
MSEQKDIIEQAVWSSDYACSLTQEQGCEELQNRLFDSINKAVESLSTQEPVRGIVDQLSMQAPLMTCWKVFPGHFDQERFTFPLRVSLLGGTKPNASAIGNTLGAVPIVVDNDGEETYVFEVEAFLHIGDTGDLSTSIRYVNTAIAQLHSYAEWDSDQGELYGCFDY